MSPSSISSTIRTPATVLAEYRRQLHSVLVEQLAHYVHPTELYEPFHYVMTLEGKYMRPLITMLCASFQPEALNEAVYAGLALEIMHTFTLVHDDIMDKSPLRRGQPSVHMKWDESTAILSGDVMMGVAYDVLLRHVHPRHAAEVLSIFTRGFIDVCEGQAMDMSFANRSQVSMDEYLVMIEKKTARLPQTAAKMGATLAGLDRNQSEALGTFALQTGIAFQIQDDLLDLLADQAELGKKVGQDIIEGKQTYLMVKLFESVPSESPDRALLQQFALNKGLPESALPDVRTLMNRYDVFENAEQEIARRYGAAMEALMLMPEGESRNGLVHLVHLLGERRK